MRVVNLSKQYRIGAKQVRYKTLRDVLIDAMYTPFQRLRPASFQRSGVQGANGDDTIWALKDVSFEVKRGEVVGIIGRNGAGKSTLLKILTRITEPTEGYAEIRGRVASLLEVGTGFHPELTGRENTYLNGAILGMKRGEIDRRFDEIVAFADVEKFIDTPVKHYSDGMRVRLAFAVAAHLEPEILLVDEVLAVGDVAFRKKCLGKMGEVAGEGRTVLLVSHNMAAIEALCHRVVLLEQGRVVSSGAPTTTITHYLSRTTTLKTANQDLSTHVGRLVRGEPVLRRIRLLDLAGKETSVFRLGNDISFEITVDMGSLVLTTPWVRLAINNARGIRVCNLFMDQTSPLWFQLRGKALIACRWHECRLVPGTYYVKLEIAGSQGTRVDVVEDAIAFEIIPADLYGTGKIEMGGIFEPQVSWAVDGLLE